MSKLLKQQLHAILQKNVDVQKGEDKKGSKRTSKGPQSKQLKKVQKPSRTQLQDAKQDESIASNLRYFAKTTANTGTPAQELVAQVRTCMRRRRRRRRRHPLCCLPASPSARLPPCPLALPL